MNEFTSYKRAYIQIASGTVALVHILDTAPISTDKDIERLDEVYEIGEKCPEYHNQYRKDAEQFIKQLEGNECKLFIEALRDACNEYLKEE